MVARHEAKSAGSRKDSEMDPTASKRKESKGGNESSSKSGRKNAAPEEGSGKEVVAARKSSSGLDGSLGGPPVLRPPVVGSDNASPASSSSRIPASNSSRATVDGSPQESDVVVNIPYTEQRIPKKTALILIAAVAMIVFVVIFVVTTIILARKEHKVDSHALHHRAASFPFGANGSSWMKTTRKPTQLKTPAPRSVLVPSTAVATPGGMITTAPSAVTGSLLVTTVSLPNMPRALENVNVSLDQETSTVGATGMSLKELLQTDTTEKNGTAHSEVSFTSNDNNPMSDATETASEVSAVVATSDVKFSHASEENHPSSQSDLDTPFDSGTASESQAADAPGQTTNAVEDASGATSSESGADSGSQASDAPGETTNAVEEASGSTTREIPQDTTALSQEDIAATPEETSISS